MINGWVEKRLGDLGKTQTGSTPKTSQADNFGNFIPFSAPADFCSDGHIKYNNKGLSEKGLKGSRLIDAGSVLMVCIGATIGKCGFNEKDIAVNQQINAITPNPDLSSKFLYYQMLTSSFQRAVIHSSGQATLPIINKTKWSNLSVSIPSLPEQKRIVDILDEAFVGISQAVANAEKNIVNTRELFESYLNNVFTQKDEEWAVQPLSELCDGGRIITYGVIKLGKEIPDGVPCLRTSNVRWLYIDTENIKEIAPKLSDEYKRTILHGGEVLVNVRGTLGGVAVATQEMEGWNVSREVAVVPVDPILINPEYLSYFIGTKTSQDWLTGVQKGVAYTGINLIDLRQLPITFPDMKLQTSIVNKVDLMISEVRRLEAIYQQKLTALTELKQSILQKAFTGELTNTQDKQLMESA